MPFQVTMRIVAHVVVHVNETNEGDAQTRAGNWVEQYLPKALEDDVNDATVTDIEHVDTFELSEEDANVKVLE
jgi:hypothetical protein